ncbi:MAG: DUF2334 domain-containing protein [Proteobacteria bacterium]|nr:DUF2334 domain-containing protein [Pseudomonadota bacterium]
MKRIYYLLISTVLFSFIIILPLYSSEAKSLNIVFRYDDFSSISSDEFDIKILNVFQKYNIHCTFGVIPFVVEGNQHNPISQPTLPLSDKKAEIVREGINKGFVEVGLHGYTHQTYKIPSDRIYSEFSGVPFKIQESKIVQAKTFLEKRLATKISTFIPPWNTFDANTLTALQDNGFKQISAYIIRADSLLSSRLKSIPAVCGLSNLKEAIESARKIKDPQSVIVVLFHSYDFKGMGTSGIFTYDDLDNILSWLSSQQDINSLTIREAAERIEDLSGIRLMKYDSYLKSISLIPHQLYPASPHVYYSTNIFDKLILRAWIITFVFYFILILIIAKVSFFVGSVVLRKSRFTWALVHYGSLFLVLFILFYFIHYRILNAYYHGTIYYKVMFFISLITEYISWLSALIKARINKL